MRRRASFPVWRSRQGESFLAALCAAGFSTGPDGAGPSGARREAGPQVFSGYGEPGRLSRRDRFASSQRVNAPRAPFPVWRSRRGERVFWRHFVPLGSRPARTEPGPPAPGVRQARKLLSCPGNKTGGRCGAACVFEKNGVSAGPYALARRLTMWRPRRRTRPPMMRAQAPGSGTASISMSPSGMRVMLSASVGSWGWPS
jgi:hypothetical protein